MDGILNIRKPSGPTSHDIVARIRRILGQKRVGHTGTLDPMAEGVLVICVGRATRLAQFLMGADKEYRCTVVLGAETDTQDRTGRVTEEHDASWVTREQFADAAAAFVGEIEQVPPMVSALKHGGRRLYDIARQGGMVERKPRRIAVYSLDVLSFEAGKRASAEIVVRCSSGTYIRTLCADIGAKLGCPAHMGSLCRLRVGRFGMEDAVSVEQLALMAEEGRLQEGIIEMETVVSDMPAAHITAQNASLAAHGMQVACDTQASDGSRVRIKTHEGAFVGIGSVVCTDTSKSVKPTIVLVGPD